MWQCKNCGESLADDFDTCWKCGSDQAGQRDESFRPEDDDRAVPDPGVEPDAAAVHGTTATVTSDRQGTGWRRLAWPWTWFTRRSCVVIAFTLQVAYWSLRWFVSDDPWNHTATIASQVGFGMALFVPGAIQRRNWWHILIMAIAGGVTPFATSRLVDVVDDSQILLLFTTWPLVMMLLVAGGEWLLREGRQFRTLLWLVACCLAAAALETIVTFFTRHSVLPYLWSGLLAAPLLALFTWAAITIAFKLSGAGLRGRTVAAAAIATSLALYVLTFTWGVYELATLSFRGHGPFLRTYGVLFLEIRGREADYEFILDELRGADWSSPYTLLPGSGVVSETPDDWQPTAVKVLIKHDRAWAAEQLAQLLLERPSKKLVDMSLELFVEQRRYETVPLLIRYAFVDEGSNLAIAVVGAGRFTKALEDLRVPQTASVLFLRTAFTRGLEQFGKAKLALRSRPPESAKSYILDPSVRTRLTRLLSADAGPTFGEWTEQYDSLLEQAPSPLSESQKSEAERVVSCFWEYYSARGDWAQARAVATRKVADSKLEALRGKSQVEALHEVINRMAAGEQGAMPPRDSELGRALVLWIDLRREAYDQSDLPEPNWNVPTIDALEKEVQSYIERVKEAMSKGP